MTRLLTDLPAAQKANEAVRAQKWLYHAADDEAQRSKQ